MRKPTIISGGQTGADKGGLQAALNLGLPTGGTAPANYRTERGPDPTLRKFGLVAQGTYKERTIANVCNSDATVIFITKPSPGSQLTINQCRRLGRPYLIVDPFSEAAVQMVADFIRTVRPGIINIAGHRESICIGIHDRVVDVLSNALRTAI